MKVYNLQEIAEILRVSVYTVRNYVREKRIKTINTGGAIRVSEKQLNDFLEGK